MSTVHFMDIKGDTKRAVQFKGVKRPEIYAYTTPEHSKTPWKGEKQGTGLLKIGYTEIGVEKRIRQQFPVKTPNERPFETLVIESAITNQGLFFRDSRVHKVLEANGFRKVAGEWFEATPEDVKNAILEVREGRSIHAGRSQNFAMRPEQMSAVNITKNYFLKYNANDNSRSPHFLWNAKMRFGKTFAAYQLAKAMNWKKILVLTYKPAVESAWHEDLKSHIDFEGWQFLGKGDSFDAINEEMPFVWFSSFQDITGKTKSGKIKDRLEAAHIIDWDCVIIDEYHFGAWREAARSLYDADSSERPPDNLDFEEEAFPLSVKHFLYLSGTPFRALANGEFLEDQIFNWTYSDEQRAKENWKDVDGPNPYEEMPEIILMTYVIPDEIREAALKSDQNEFDLNVFFKAKEIAGESPCKPNRFVFEYEKEVQMWLHSIRGTYMPSHSIGGKDATPPPEPYGDVRFKKNLVHTFWFLPSVAACYAMKELLSERQNSFFNDYRIIVAAGKKAGVGLKAIGPVKKAMENPLSTKTITLSCGKLTTGVSVAPWTAIFMLKNTSSPETYFQAAFRVQTPWVVRNIDGSDPHKKSIIKQQCYVFDFAPNRALQQIAEYSARLDINESSTVQEKVEDFIRFLPVLCYDGYAMHRLNATQILDIVTAGTGSTMLARSWQSPQMVNVDNATLERLMASPSAMAALENIEGFRNLSKDIIKVIASEKALNKTKKEGKKHDEKEKGQQQENAGFKKLLKERLIKFVTRIPVFMYLTDHREQDLKDVILNLEPSLFTKVTGLKVEEFEELCEIGVFSSQNMNSAIYAFKRFEEASLTYAGDKELSDTVGGWDTTTSRDELHLLNDGIS